MTKPSQSFELRMHSVTMQVYPIPIPKYRAYRVVFSSLRQPLVLARAKDAGQQGFWTSIPEGRQKEAEGVGQLIDAYLHHNDL